jgi:NADH-quinone oxidoreductase subunit C
MTAYAVNPHELAQSICKVLGEKVCNTVVALGEVTIEVPAQHYFAAMQQLHDAPACKFNQLIDLCGVDYLNYRDEPWSKPRFCVVLHLLSTTLNQRVRVKVFAPDDAQPQVASVNAIWNAANWFEREAFDLYGIIFTDHPDLRRILTDYGFIGHPMRKDFPVSGHVEMHYDEAQKRVVYRPVSIEPREITPRVIRENGYGGLG